MVEVMLVVVVVVVVMLVVVEVVVLVVACRLSETHHDMFASCLMSWSWS